jgi:hypothetical protein
MKNHYPIDEHGHMLDSEDYCYRRPVTWLPLGVFKATLQFIDTERGRSSFRLRCVNVDTGMRMSVMYNSCDDFIKRSISGRLKATWEVVKRGGSYGVVLLEESEYE